MQIPIRIGWLPQKDGVKCFCYGYFEKGNLTIRRTSSVVWEGPLPKTCIKNKGTLKFKSGNCMNELQGRHSCFRHLLAEEIPSARQHLLPLALALSAGHTLRDLLLRPRKCLIYCFNYSLFFFFFPKSISDAWVLL